MDKKLLKIAREIAVRDATIKFIDSHREEIVKLAEPRVLEIYEEIKAKNVPTEKKSPAL